MRAGLSSRDPADAGAAGEGLDAQASRPDRPEERSLLDAGLARARARVARRIGALEGDLERIAHADLLASRAQLFVVAAARAPRGTIRLNAVDWSSGTPAPIEWTFNPALSPKEQIDAVFRRARRLKGGAPIARGRLSDARGSLAALDALRARLAAEPESDTEAIVREARAIAPRDFVPPRPAGEQGKAGKKGDAPALPYRTFVGASSSPIWVGRGAAQNDDLTLHFARPHHLWLHAKGQAGAHVVVPLDKGASCPGDLLVEAAHLAAYFSRARNEAVVEVTYVAKRHVRKPRGSPPGLVVVAREKVLVLRRSETIMRRLLDRELAGS
jgi:predicted ribosome quality control (RQC) complex YloA/Tae2 family protein